MRHPPYADRWAHVLPLVGTGSFGPARGGRLPDLAPQDPTVAAGERNVSLSDDLERGPISEQNRVERERTQHPQGWEPGVAWNGTDGSLTTGPLTHAPDRTELLQVWNLDPQTYEVVEPVQYRAWDANLGEGNVQRLFYYRTNVRLRTGGPDAEEDIEALCRLIQKRTPIKAQTVEGERAFVASLNDLQVGKGEGDGTDGIVSRTIAGIDQMGQRLRELHKAGRAPGKIVVANNGDLTERVSGHYPAQKYTVDRTERDQQRIARRLLLRAVDAAASSGVPTIVTAVPCNHGENRENGKNQTTPTDNLSLTLTENVYEICQANPERYGHVSFVLAPDLVLVLDVAGVPVAFTHGHQFRGSGHPANIAETWWKGQVMGNQPVADARILLTAHRHHLCVSEHTGRVVLLAPANDGGSYWYTSATGHSSPPGMLTFGVGTAYGDRGWGDMQVLGEAR